MTDIKLTITCGARDTREPMHVDQFIDFGTYFDEGRRPKNEKYARWVLNHFRLPAITKMAFNEFMKEHKLFCVFENEKYRVTGASRLGDIWLTKDFTQSTGYQKRVMVAHCSEWSKE